MTTARGADLRRTSIRVALAATGLVAVAYLIVAVAVVAIVTRNLTAQIDGRLSDSLLHPPGPGPGPGHSEPPKPDRLGGPTFVLWTVMNDGQVSTVDTNPGLPEEYRHVA